MSKKVWFIILVAVALALTLSACQKSASKPPAPTATTSGNLPFPTPIPDDALKNIQAATQTALALTSANGTPSAATPTQGAVAPTTSAPTATPVPLLPTATKVVVVVPSATPGHPSSYTLQKGEFPFCIARRFNVSIASLLSINGLTIDSRPAVGTTLKVPADSAWDTGSRSLISHPASYTVKSGDTIYSVACAYGDVDPNAIIAANSLQSPYSLNAGDTLQIP